MTITTKSTDDIIFTELRKICVKGESAEFFDFGDFCKDFNLTDIVGAIGRRRDMQKGISESLFKGINYVQ